MLYCFFFFFSSRRRHTRLTCDWSSDVCSSDLLERLGDVVQRYRHEPIDVVRDGVLHEVTSWTAKQDDDATLVLLRRSQRSEEHTSELQSHVNLVCRLLLEKKKKNQTK